MERDNGDQRTPWGEVALASERGPIDRSYWVVADRLVGGAYPFQPDPDEGLATLRRIESAGVGLFVNLTQDTVAGSPDSHLTPYHDSVGPSTVIEFHPIVDLQVPTIEEMVETLDTIDRALNSGRTAYVHCWGGVGRTGTVIGCWLIRHRAAAPDEALNLLALLRRQDTVAGRRPAPETAGQRAFVRAWLPAQ